MEWVKNGAAFAIVTCPIAYTILALIAELEKFKVTWLAIGRIASDRPSALKRSRSQCPHPDGMMTSMRQAAAIPNVFGASDALAEVCRRFHVRRLDLFGSAATGNGFDPARSDIDLLVTFQESGPAGYADTYFGLHEALEALAGRSVDLITDAAIKNPYLRRRLESERRVLFEAP